VKLLVFSDLHLEAGSKLGTTDKEFGSTRLRDAAATLGRIRAAADEEGVVGVVFGGDIGRTPRPGPLAYRLFNDAFRRMRAPHFLAVQGNHDYLPERDGTALHVVAQALRGRALARPQVLRLRVAPQLTESTSMLTELQVGVLPWTPPTMLFDRAPNDPRELNKLVAARLHEIAVGLGEQLDPTLPSVLIGHWHVAGEDLPDIIRDAEPVLDPDLLEASGPWDALLFGHYHLPGRLGKKTWSIGPPMRTSFGEDTVETGYLEVVWSGWHAPDEKPEDVAYVRQVPLPDRELVTIELDADAVLSGTMPGIPVRALRNAIVRVRYTCSEEQARAMAAGPVRRYIDQVYEHGALRVIGPEVTVLREERERRSALRADVAPLSALDTYMEKQEVPEDLRARVREEAERVVGEEVDAG
jgi:DNA repair exonuclease SbcCD nuclease subunit